MHTQMRQAQGMLTYWSCGDLQRASDLASIRGMLESTYLAGICGGTWLLLDDVMHSDTQNVGLHGLVSSLFRPGV